MDSHIYDYMFIFVVLDPDLIVRGFRDHGLGHTQSHCRRWFRVCTARLKRTLKAVRSTPQAPLRPHHRLIFFDRLCFVRARILIKVRARTFVPSSTLEGMRWGKRGFWVWLFPLMRYFSWEAWWLMVCIERRMEERYVKVWKYAVREGWFWVWLLWLIPMLCRWCRNVDDGR